MENTFGIPIITDNEQLRLENLYQYEVLETYDKAGTFRQVAAMAAKIFKAPIGLVSFVDEKRVVFKGNIGMEGTTEASRGVSLCSLAVLNDKVTVFKNAKEEACLAANPLVTGSFGLRFYAAAPLITPDGYKIGAVCIVDKKAREFTPAEQELLESLAAIVMDELEERRLLKKAC